MKSNIFVIKHSIILGFWRWRIDSVGHHDGCSRFSQRAPVLARCVANSLMLHDLSLFVMQDSVRLIWLCAKYNYCMMSICRTRSFVSLHVLTNHSALSEKPVSGQEGGSGISAPSARTHLHLHYKNHNGLNFRTISVTSCSFNPTSLDEVLSCNPWCQTSFQTPPTSNERKKIVIKFRESR